MIEAKMKDGALFQLMDDLRQKISDGKVNGNQISFAITREFNGNSFTQKYSGKVEGDTITGKISFTGRDGENRDRDWVAKRAKDTKKDS